MPPLGMVLFTILTDGQHPYGLTGRKESVAPAMKVFLLKIVSYNKLYFLKLPHDFIVTSLKLTFFAELIGASILSQFAE